MERVVISIFASSLAVLLKLNLLVPFVYVIAYSKLFSFFQTKWLFSSDYINDNVYCKKFK